MPSAANNKQRVVIRLLPSPGIGPRIPKTIATVNAVAIMIMDSKKTAIVHRWRVNRETPAYFCPNLEHPVKTNAAK